MAESKKAEDKAASEKAAEEESPDKDVTVDAEGRPENADTYDPNAERSEYSDTGDVPQP
jgi:hypothetical protein